MSTERRSGPALARNLGAKSATGDVLFFLDSDVCVRPDTLSRISDSFAADATLDGLIGSYDSAPQCQDFVSQYRNLLHSYVHHISSERASTFWSGCGAIRRSVFLEYSGFNEAYGRPAIEDIELGYRLIRGGNKILLNRDILVTHLKRWTFFGLIKTDILDRGVPWTELILRDRFMPNDLNLQFSQRVSVALVFILVALSGTMAILDGAYMLIPLFALVFLTLGRWWSELGTYRRPRRAFALLIGAVALVATVAYSHRMFGLIPPLVVSPALLFLRHRYNKQGRIRKQHRWLFIVFICTSILVTAFYLPSHYLVFACMVLLVLLGLINSQFYFFLAGKRGIVFMIAAIPFHLLYHFYNGLSFVAGAMLHYWNVFATGHGQTPTNEIPRLK
jgi:glycosyltransferase involved in cell wall biosynthesis